MKSFLNKINKKILSILIIYCLIVIIFFEPNYSADSLRYVFAGYQLFEIVFRDLREPIFSLKFDEQILFHSGIDYSFPKREFFTIIPNIIFYLLSIVKIDGLNFFMILNLIIYSSLVLICVHKFNKDENFYKFLLILFLFFGHYQIAGWNIKILPEILFFSLCLIFLISLFQTKKFDLNNFFRLLLLSIICFLIRPQGIIIVAFIILIFPFNSLFIKKNYKLISIIFSFSIFLIPLILYLDISGKINFPIINSYNTGLHDGAIISGWLNYFNNKLIYQEIRFNDKQMNFEQTLNYLDVLKITILRLINFINPYKFYHSPFINLWNIIYFGILYLSSIYLFILLNDELKKNFILTLLFMILIFHQIFPVTGTVRYQLSLIAINFILILDNLDLLIKRK